MKILFFSPHAFFQIHALPEALVAECLALEGNEIEIINCNGVFKESCLCMPLSIVGDLKSQKNVCKQCIKNRNAINREFKFNATNLESYVTTLDLKWVNSELAKLDAHSFKHYSIQGIPIGQYALYEYLMELKISGETFTQDQWEQFFPKLRNALLTYVGITAKLKESAPDRVVLYNSLYSVNRIVSAVANSQGIPSFSLHAGYHLKDRIRQLMIFKGNGSHLFVSRHPYLRKLKDTPLTTLEVARVESHVRELISAASPWVYSSKNMKLPCTEVRKKIGINPSQKVVLAVMRSNDELQGARTAGIDMFQKSELFSSQIDWLIWLKSFCENTPEIFVVFRIHPREFPNKRENVTSGHAQQFLEQIKKLELPQNLYLNLPTDGFSLHEIMKISDLVLNNSSTAGLEASLFGIPVLGLGGDLYAFDNSLQIEPRDLEDYERNILDLANSGWKFEKVIKAYRWLGFLFSEVDIDITDGYSKRLSSINRFLSFIGRGLRKLGLWYPDLAITAEVRGRSKPLKEAQKLVFAISNSAESHVGQFKREQVGSSKIEAKLIQEAYLRLVKSVSAANDPEIEKRMAQILTRS